MFWQKNLKLEESEKLRFVESFTFSMLEQKVWQMYRMIDRNGNEVGRVEFRENISTEKPLHSSYSVDQFMQ